jgi:hypothetical protein
VALAISLRRSAVMGWRVRRRAADGPG